MTDIQNPKTLSINDLEPRQSKDTKAGATVNLEPSGFAATTESTQKVPGRLKWSDVTLERGVTS